MSSSGYSLWYMPSAILEKGLNQKATAEVLAKIKNLKESDLVLKKKEKTKFEERLKAFETPVTASTLKFSVS